MFILNTESALGFADMEAKRSKFPIEQTHFLQNKYILSTKMEEVSSQLNKYTMYFLLILCKFPYLIILEIIHVKPKIDILDFHQACELLDKYTIFCSHHSHSLPFKFIL